MAEQGNEEFFNIPSLKRSPGVQSPWQNTTLQNGFDHVYGNSPPSVNGIQNFHGARQNIGNSFGGQTLGSIQTTTSFQESPGTPTCTTGNAQSDNLETWDPMGVDYSCPTFNCYKNFNVLASEPPKNRSPEKFLSSSPTKQNAAEDISLYVANIPIQMTQEGLRNLFQGAGKVYSCCVIPQRDTNLDTKIGFVTFHSWKEASKAIECYDGFSLGNNAKLRVKVANRKGRRASDVLAPKDEDSAGSDTFVQPNVNGFNEKDDSGSELDKNSNVVLEKEIHHNSTEPAGVTKNTSAIPSKTSSPDMSPEARPCTKCQKLSSQRCSACKAPYCSRECQKADRINHKDVCTYQGNVKKATSVTSTVKEVPQYDPFNDPDFDCIDISITNDVTDNSKKKTEGGLSDKETTDNETTDNEVRSTQTGHPPSETSHGPANRVSQVPPAPSLVPDEFRLLVSTVVSGSLVWGQVISDDVLPRFVALTKDMAKINEGSLERILEPAPGMYCLTRFNLDGDWYRSRVERCTNDNKVEVFFVDYGNKEWKEKHEMYYLPPQYSDLAAQARLFTLSSVTVSQNVDVQRIMLTFLDGLVSAKTISAEVVRVVPGCYPEVILRERGAQHTVNELMSDHQRELESSLGMGSATSQPSNAHPEYTAAPQYPQLSGQPQRVVTSPPSCAKGLKTYMASAVAREDLPTEKTFDIVVSDISSPSLFWILLETASDKLILLSNLLEVAYKDSEFSDYVPGVGELIVAKFTDSLWYRAKVDCIYNDGTLRVTFVDFGNSEDVGLSDVRRITGELVAIPKLAIKCSLIGVESLSKTGGWSAECIELCRSLMLNTRCKATVVGHVRDTVMLTVQSSLTPDGSVYDVTEELVTRGYAKSTKQELAQSNVNQGHRALQSPAFQETITQDTFSTGVHCSSEGGINTAPTKGQSAPRHIPSVNTSPSISSSHQLSDSTSIQNKTRSYPQLVPTNCSGSPQDTSVPEPKLQRDLSLGNQPPRHLTENSPPNPTFTQNETRSHVPELSHGNTSRSYQDTIGSPETTPQHGPSRSNQPRVLPLANIPPGSFDVIVRNVISGDEVYVQMISPQLVHMLHKCVRELNEFCEGSKAPSDDVNIEIGSLGCAKFSLDNVWYRAQVVTIETNGYRVRFVDFGNTEVVSTDAFRHPPESFYQLAPQALRCRLAFSSGNEGWGEQSKEMVLKLTTNKQLSCTVLDQTSSPFSVKLEHCVDSQRIDIAKELQKEMSPHASSENTSRRGSSSSDNARTRSRFSQSVLTPALTSAAIGGLGAECDLLVTEAAHPTYFWAQLAVRSNIEELNLLTQELNAHYNNTSYPPFEVKVDQFCACKFSLDNLWYRGFVKCDNSNGIAVHFVDFGNSELTTAGMLRPLESQFQVQPCRALLCSIACLEPVEGKLWSKEAIAYFKSKVLGKVLKCTVVYNSYSRVFIDIQDPESDGGESLKTSLLEKSMAKQVGNYSLSPQRKGFPGQDHKRGQTSEGNHVSGIPAELSFEHNSFHQRNQGSQAVGHGNAVGGTSPVTGGTSSTVGGTSSQVGRTSSEARKASPLGGTSSQVGRTSSQVSSPSSLVGGTSLSVCGASSLVGGTSSQVGCTSSQVGCTSSPVGSTSSPVGGTMAPVLGNLPNQANRDFPEAHKRIPVSDEPSTTSSRGTPEELERTMVSEFKPVTLINLDHMSVLVCVASGPREIYFHVIDSDGVRAYTALFDRLQIQFINTNQVYVPIPGELCCAKFSFDNCWYRAAVSNVDANTGFATVQFVDYGNRDNVAFSSLRPITPSLTELPFQAQHVSLAGVSLDDAAWTQERLAYLTAVLMEKPLIARVIQQAQGVVEVELYDTSGEEDILINSLFTEQGHSAAATQPNNPSSTSGPAMPDVTPKGHDTANTIPEVIPTESEFEVLVTEVNGPDCFWVQHVVMDTITQFTLMTQQMNFVCESTVGGLGTVNVGDVCCCKFACDGQWYRARVEAFLPNGLVRVFYVDFGNSEEVEPTALKPLDQACVQFPTQAVQCTLANLQPAHGAWSAKAIEWLKMCIMSKRLFARVVGRNGSVLQLELIDTSNPDRDVFINFEMVQTEEARMA